MYQLDKDIWFPDPDLAEQDGLLAFGGDLRPERLVLAYQHGIFPWYSRGQPILWWSPDPRFVLFPDRFKLRRSLRKVINQDRFEIRYDTAFGDVLRHCAEVPREDQDGTWITTAMERAYLLMHHLGHAHSVEAWQDDRLVGGLYGIAMGPFFFGESMFHLESDASKVALAALVSKYQKAPFIDCQVHNDFFESMGAEHIPRQRFRGILNENIHEPSLWGPNRTGF